MNADPKYSLAEIERRWLVDLKKINALDTLDYRDIEDLYLPNTGLRLRKITHSSGEIFFKFCKKYAKTSALSQPITNLYLTEMEYNLLSNLEGNPVCKRRYTFRDGVLDAYADKVAIFEMEFNSEEVAKQYLPPNFVYEEVTDNLNYSGAALVLELNNT